MPFSLLDPPLHAIGVLILGLIVLFLLFEWMVKSKIRRQ